MKIKVGVVSLMAMCCFVGCSEEDSASSSSSSKSSGKSKRLVPTTAAEVMASTDYKLEHTTKSVVKCYVRPLTPEIVKSISEDSPDHEFLNGEDDGVRIGRSNTVLERPQPSSHACNRTMTS